MKAIELSGESPDRGIRYRPVATFREQTSSISVDGNQILNSTTAEFAAESSPVSLTAGRKVPVQVEILMDCSHKGTIDERPAVAMLSWQGPGVKKQLVPSTALSPPEGTEGNEGLLREFSFEKGGDKTTITRLDPQVNFVWYDQALVASDYDEIRSSLAQRLFDVVTNPSTLESWESNQDAPRTRWEGHWAFLESLSVGRQGQWVQALIAHPALLVDCSAQDIDNLYSRCRIGASDDAIGLVGEWALLHADDAPTFSIDFYDANRSVYRRMAQKIAWQTPSHLERLEQDYLETQDGQCALPTAYILCYGHWMKGNVIEWIDKLDARLDNETLTGDARVNWLLARAQAEEIRRSPPRRHWNTVERRLAGQGWIEEACLVAKSEASKLRAHKELASRFAGKELIDRAEQVLADAARRCTASESTDSLAGWGTELSALSQAIEAKHAGHEAQIQQAYFDRLKLRRQDALVKGDSTAASRYKDLLSAAGENEE